MFGNKKSGSAGALPPAKYRMGGKHFKNDAAFIKTAVRDVKRLEPASAGAAAALRSW